MSSCCTITPVYIYDDIHSGLLERVVLSTVDFLQNQITIHVIVEFFLPFFTTLNSEAPSGASFFYVIIKCRLVASTEIFVEGGV